MCRIQELLVSILFLGSVTVLQAACEGSETNAKGGEGAAWGRAGAACFALPGPQDEGADLEAQETRLSRMIDQLLEAQWYLKKARTARIPRRVETLAREIEERLQPLVEAKACADGGGGFTDPACRGKFEENILPKLASMEKEWGRFLSLHLACTPGDLAAFRDDMRAALSGGDRRRCVTLYHELQKRIGERPLRYADLLEARFRPILGEILQLAEAAQEKGAPPPPAAEPAPLLEPNAVAFLVRVIPRQGDAYPAVIKDPGLRDLLARKGRILPGDLASKSQIMLHYMRGLNGTMGLSVERVKEIRADRPLDEKGLASVKALIARRIDRLEPLEVRRKTSIHAEPARRRTGAQSTAAKAPPDSPAPAAPTWPLLHRFPPEKGWGPDRKAEIERRKVVLGVFPDPEEQAFLDRFDDWCKELAQRKAAKGKPAGGKPKNH